MRERHWDPCVSHFGNEANQFIEDYFADKDRRVFLVAGAGFDPRSTQVASRLASVSSNVQALFVRESRPDPDTTLVSRAEKNTKTLCDAISDHLVEQVDIFGADGAVVGGRNMISVLSNRKFENVTDIVIDISALSAGTSFPTIRYFVELVRQSKVSPNLHVFVAHDPQLDTDIRSRSSDAPDYVHGFKGGATLDGASSSAKLWLPQLATGRRGALGRLYDFIKPHDTCPILPFPGTNPRLGDELVEEYMIELEDTWVVDTRNIVYADEADPLDLYRTILRLDDLRKPVFEGAGGSLLVLSPLGSKIMALGAVLAALERNLPVAHLEPIGYDFTGQVPDSITEPSLVHIWLEGDAYIEPRSALAL